MPLPFPNSEGSKGIFPANQKDLEVLFAEEFVHLSGKFAFCLDEADAAHQLSRLVIQKKWTKLFTAEDSLLPFIESARLTSDLSGCEASLTTCHYLVARTGAIVLSSRQNKGRTTSVYAPVHICIAYTDQLVFDTREALKLMKEQYGSNLPSSITFAAGPSRTADIEKTLVVGVHGPMEVYVFLIYRQEAD